MTLTILAMRCSIKKYHIEVLRKRQKPGKGSFTYQLTLDRGGVENFVSIASARGGSLAKMSADKM